jgi:hypothetical protein
MIVARAKIQGYVSGTDCAFYVVAVALYKDGRYWKHRYLTLHEPCTIQDLHDVLRERHGASQVYVQQQFWSHMPSNEQLEAFWYSGTIDS